MNDIVDISPKEQVINQIKKIELDDNGLIKGFNYVFDENGKINWRLMVPIEYLYVNPSNKAKMEKKYGKPYDSLNPVGDKIEDIDLVITLGGLKYLLKIHRYKSVKFNIKESGEDYASVNCEILFCGNYDSLGQDILYSENACAHSGNTTNFAKQYLLEMATNRAFARCIRSYLNINIVSREELGSADIQEEPKNNNLGKQISLLEELMDKKKVSFKIIEDKLRQSEKWNDKYKSVKDLPPEIIFEYLTRLKNYEPTN